MQQSFNLMCENDTLFLFWELMYGSYKLHKQVVHVLLKAVAPKPTRYSIIFKSPLAITPKNTVKTQYKSDKTNPIITCLVLKDTQIGRNYSLRF